MEISEGQTEVCSSLVPKHYEVPDLEEEILDLEKKEGRK